MPPYQQPGYQPVKDCTYRPVWGAFDNWNVIQFAHKIIPRDYIEKIHYVVLDYIGDNMA